MKYSLAIVMLLACASLVQAEPGNGNAYGKAHAPGQNKAPGEPAQGHAHGKNKQKTLNSKNKQNKKTNKNNKPNKQTQTTI